MLYIKIKFFSRENKLYRLFSSNPKSYLPFKINKKIFMELYSAKNICENNNYRNMLKAIKGK